MQQKNNKQGKPYIDKTPLKDPITELLEVAIEKFQAGLYQETVEICDSVIAMKQDCFRAYHGKALALTHLKDFDHAMHAYETALEINPNAQKFSKICKIMLFNILNIIVIQMPI